MKKCTFCIDSDEYQGGLVDKNKKDPLHIPDGPITRSRAKKIKEAMQGLVQSTWAKSATSKTPTTFKMGSNEVEPSFVHVIEVGEKTS